MQSLGAPLRDMTMATPLSLHCPVRLRYDHNRPLTEACPTWIAYIDTVLGHRAGEP